jgi:hypothetical protein
MLVGVFSCTYHVHEDLTVTEQRHGLHLSPYVQPLERQMRSERDTDADSTYGSILFSLRSYSMSISKVQAGGCVGVSQPTEMCMCIGRRCDVEDACPSSDVVRSVRHEAQATLLVKPWRLANRYSLQSEIIIDKFVLA